MLNTIGSIRQQYSEREHIMQPWYLIETEVDYQRATAHYEESLWEMPEVDPVELIKIRMEEFGYKASDLAKEYGDKGTVSKVLNYRQALSMTMIRKFSKLLRIPIEALTKEYTLQ